MFLPPKKPMSPMMPPDGDGDEPGGPPMDDSAMKAKMLMDFMATNKSKMGDELKSKYAPPETPKPEVVVQSPIDGTDTRKTGVTGPNGSEDVGDPMQLLAVLDSDAVRKLLGDTGDMDLQGLLNGP